MQSRDYSEAEPVLSAVRIAINTFIVNASRQSHDDMLTSSYPVMAVETPLVGTVGGAQLGKLSIKRYLQQINSYYPAVRYISFLKGI